MIVFGLITNYYPRIIRSNQKNIPLSRYKVNVLSIEIPYINFLLFFIVTLGVGIYLFNLSNENSKIDKESKKDKKRRFLIVEKIKLWYSKIEIPQLKKRIVRKKSSKKYYVKHIIETITVFALFYTFYLGFSKGNTLCFFIVVSYYYLLSVDPKSIVEVVVKSICYPLLFVIVFAFSDVHQYYNFIQKISSNLFPYFISVLAIFFSLRDKLKNKRSFSLKHPLFFLFVYMVIVSITYFFV